MGKYLCSVEMQKIGGGAVVTYKCIGTNIRLRGLSKTTNLSMVILAGAPSDILMPFVWPCHRSHSLGTGN